ncbi:hypothetical protein [Natronocalculus amylovorans]|uniref:Uncharacterized protein n=1 Tax=Natronocalculus amylovorans TaxID=2917812 RepID=A0AAE3FZQ9_9EURY|nr:hypothetical protein [Natronocalculus amylovorans]MCL9818326.1 hypothetical protein [Natronocalculus amylovorans]
MAILTTLLVLTIAVFVLAFIFRNGTILTPLPQSTAKWLKRIFRGSVGITLWRIILVFVFFSGAYALVVGFGMVGSFVAALILTTLAADEVRKWILDLWNFDFYRVGA